MLIEDIIMTGGVCKNCLEHALKNVEFLVSNYNFKKIVLSPKISDFSSVKEREELFNLFKNFKDKVDILFDEQIEELKSFNKLIPTIKKYGYNNNFITFDDDIMFYTPFGKIFVNRLLNLVKTHPDNVVAMEENNFYLDYKNKYWLQNKLTISQKFTKEESYAGYLSNFCYFPKNSLNYYNILLENDGKIVKRIMTVDNRFRSHDEMFFSALTTLNRVKCITDVFLYSGLMETDIFMNDLNDQRLSINEGLDKKEINTQLDINLNIAFPDIFNIVVNEPKILWLNNYNVYFADYINKQVTAMTNVPVKFNISEVSQSIKKFLFGDKYE